MVVGKLKSTPGICIVVNIFINDLDDDTERIPIIFAGDTEWGGMVDIPNHGTFG